MTHTPRRCFLVSVLLFVFALGGSAGAQFLPLDDPANLDSSQQISQKIVHAKKPVFIDFWAPWCMPCRMLAPTVEKLEKDYAGRVLFLSVNVDYNRQIAGYFGISGIPAIYIMKDRTVKRKIVGLQPDSVYRQALDEVCALPPDTVTPKTKKPKKG